MNLTTCLLVALGGAIGSFGRYAVALLLAPISASLPWGTVIINVMGSFLIGFFGTLTLAHGRYPVPENLRIFVMVGFCGGFTTFSSFSLQTLDLIRAGGTARALVNVGASVVLCVLAVAVGHLAAARLNGGVVSIAQLPIEEDG